MTWAPTESQKVVFSTLNGDSALQTLLGGANKIFDFVPDNNPYPYVTIALKPFVERGNHTKEGWSCEFQVNVYHQARGDKDIQAIQARINALLNDAALCVDGWTTLGCRRTFVDIITLEDNVTRMGIQKFNLLLGEE